MTPFELSQARELREALKVIPMQPAKIARLINATPQHLTRWRMAREPVDERILAWLVRLAHLFASRPTLRRATSRTS